MSVSISETSTTISGKTRTIFSSLICAKFRIIHTGLAKLHLSLRDTAFEKKSTIHSFIKALQI